MEADRTSQLQSGIGGHHPHRRGQLAEYRRRDRVTAGDDDGAASALVRAQPDLRVGLGDKLRRQSSQLDALQSLMVGRQLESDLTPAGWPVSPPMNTASTATLIAAWNRACPITTMGRMLRGNTTRFT